MNLRQKVAARWLNASSSGRWDILVALDPYIKPKSKGQFKKAFSNINSWFWLSNVDQNSKWTALTIEEGEVELEWEDGDLPWSNSGTAMLDKVTVVVAKVVYSESTQQFVKRLVDYWRSYISDPKGFADALKKSLLEHQKTWKWILSEEHLGMGDSAEDEIMFLTEPEGFWEKILWGSDYLRQCSDAFDVRGEISNKNKGWKTIINAKGLQWTSVLKVEIKYEQTGGC